MKPSLRHLAPALLAFALAPAQAADAPATAPTVITCDDFVSQNVNDQMVTDCTGHVIVTGNDILMTCDKLHVISVQSKGKSDAIGSADQFKYILATGNVHLVQGEREANCGRAEMLPQETKVTLTEHPVVVDHGNGSITTGDELDLWHNQRKVTGVHVKIQLPAMKDMGFDKKQKPPEPDAPPATLGAPGPQP